MRAICALVIPSFLLAQAKKGPPSVGYEDTPFIQGQKWRVHDIKRPHPRVIQAGPPPSDAVVLFDGKDLSKWMMQSRDGKVEPPGWKVEKGYFEVVRGTGHLVTKDTFGDCQLHVEWATPGAVHSSSQERGNSGVLLMSRYEIQVLDSFQNVTYADGQAAAIYGQFPPLVNASRGPGQWQTYDIVFEAPRFEGEKLVKPAYATVFHNGVVVHHRQEMLGPMKHRVTTSYSPHAAAEPLMLQNHGDPVRYRNIWIRPLGSYDKMTP
jgi:hypothetical protein